MSEKQSPGVVLSWKTVLVWFLAAYLVFSLYQYYDLQAFVPLMTNIALPLLFGFAALTLVVGGALRSTNAKILALYLLWIYITGITRTGYTIFNNLFIDVLTYALLCFPMAGMLPANRRRGAFRVIFYALVVFMLGMSIYALVIVLQGRMLHSPNGFMLGLHPYITNRLALYAHPNYVSTLIAMLMIITLYLALSAKKVYERVFAIVAFVIFGVIMALTDSRTGKLGVSVGVGLLGYVLATHLLRDQKRAVAVIAGIACTACVAALCYGSFSLYGWVMERVSVAQGPRMIQTALAEDAGGLGTAIQVSQRGFLADEGFNGRSDVWKAAIEAIRKDPKILLVGAGNLMDIVNQYTPKAYAHLHNSFLQTLLALGLPGFLLLATFLVRMLVQSARLLLDTSGRSTPAQRFLPALLLTCVIIGLAESHFFATEQPVYDPLFFLVAGYVQVLARRLKRKGEGAAEVTA